ncbi:hypothetical protein BDV10DRAFT_2267 [Aspergillus recurvatus]
MAIRHPCWHRYRNPSQSPEPRSANIKRDSTPCRPLLFQDKEAKSEADADTDAEDIHTDTDSTVSLPRPTAPRPPSHRQMYQRSRSRSRSRCRHSRRVEFTERACVSLPLFHRPRLPPLSANLKD